MLYTVLYLLEVMLHLPHKDICLFLGEALVTDLLYCLLYKDTVRILQCRNIFEGSVFASNRVHPNCAPLTEFYTIHQIEPSKYWY